MSAHRAKTPKSAIYISTIGLLTNTFVRFADHIETVYTVCGRMRLACETTDIIVRALQHGRAKNGLAVGFVRQSSFHGNSMSLWMNWQSDWRKERDEEEQ